MVGLGLGTYKGTFPFSLGAGTLGAHQRRPLSESLSAPGFQQQQQQQGSGSAGVGGALSADITQQYETLLRQFNLQNQQLLLQGHQVQQHYLEQQQRYWLIHVVCQCVCACVCERRESYLLSVCISRLTCMLTVYSSIHFQYDYQVLLDDLYP